MSEKAEEPKAKKKGGKLPIIIALVLVLAGGGFFFMKSKSGKKEAPAIKLGLIEPLKDEFLVNLADGDVYLRANISLHFAEGFKAEEFAKNLDAVRDAFNTKLSSKYLRELASVSGKQKLKAEMAASANKILASAVPHADEKKPDKAEAEPKVEGHEGEKGEKPGEKDKAKHEDWDSQTGPVLKVYFTTFATQ